MRTTLFFCWLLSVACQAQKPDNWGVNSNAWGGFEAPKESKGKTPVDQINKIGTELGCNLVLIQGGTFDMGEGEGQRRVTVSSCYMDETEVCNRHYRNFVQWMQKHRPDYPLERLLPDTLVWQRDLPADKADLAKHLSRDYFRQPAFDYHPVVGVSWEQAQAYAQWRSECAQALLQSKKKIAVLDIPDQSKVEIVPNDAPFLPDYRLPTEAEWEFAAHRDNHPTKYKSHFKATVEAHARQYALPDYYQQNQALLPRHVFANAYEASHLRGMEGGVSEWVMDIYRPMTSTRLIDVETEDLNPMRSDTGKTQCLPTAFLANSPVQAGDSAQLYLRTSTYYDAQGKAVSWYDFLKLQTQPASPYQVVERDAQGNLRLKVLAEKEYNERIEREQQLLDRDRVRVYKGVNAQGKHLKTIADRAPYNQTQSSAFIGFRCAMIRLRPQVASRKN